MIGPVPVPALASASRREAGFTLIESLVALAILGMLSAMLLAAVKGPSTIAQRLVQGQAGGDQVVAAQARLRSAAERMRPETRLNAAVNVVDMRGTAHDLAFFAPPLASDAPDQIKRFRLLLVANGDLVLYTANGLDERIDLSAPGLVGWQPSALLHGVTQVNLAYFGASPMTSGSSWQTRWVDRTQLPDLIRIRVDFAADDQRRWPDLIVRPEAMGGAACPIDTALIDMATGRCGEV